MISVHPGEPIEAALRRWFHAELEAILSRPEPASVDCDCCGTQIDPATAVRRDHACALTGLNLRRLVCPACGLVFGPLALIQCEPEELNRLYDLVYRYEREPDTTKWQEKTFYLLNPSWTGRYLNFACGDWSKGVQRLVDVGWDVWGYEPHWRPTSSRISSNLSELEAGGRFDALMSHNYLEHPQSVFGFFETCKRLLKPGATMAHATPCYEYLYARSPVHLYFFEGDSIDALCGRTGVKRLAPIIQDRETEAYYHCGMFQTPA